MRQAVTRALSRRQRRIAQTYGLFAVFGVSAGVIVLVLGGSGEEYTPGEEVEGLTADLARDLPADYPRVTFTDVAAESGIDFRHFPGRRTRQLPEDMGSGAAWGDYDNDGWLDLFLVDIAEPLPADIDASSPPAAPPGRSRLYRNQRDGTFADVTDRVGIEHVAVGMAATWADYDNDGWLDLFVTAFGENTLYRNQGDGTFVDATRAAGMGGELGFWTAAAWGDYDRDGHVDLYVTGYVRYTIGANVGVSELQYDVEVPVSLNPSAFRAHRNLLWHNRGDGTFREVGASAHVAGEEGRGLGAAWADFDEDGWPDLYVANDVSDNALYRNLGDGTFENVSHGALVSDYRGAMGLAVADWDGDEDLDLFITHWIAQENALFTNRSAEAASRAGPPRPLQFIDQADRFGLGQIALDYIGWGTSFFDYDNDGVLDLFVANGSTFQRPEAPELLAPMQDLLFWNRGKGEGFYDVSPIAGDYFSRQAVGRGAAFGDYDRDGDVDVLVVNHGDRPALLRNDGGTEGSWLGVLLDGRESNRSGFGARVRLVAGGDVQVRSVGSQTSYLSHNSLVQHFGLGLAQTVDTLEVVWTTGEKDIWTEIPAGRAVRLVEGADMWEELWTAERRAQGLGGGSSPPVVTAETERASTLRFWERMRAATRERAAGRLEEAADNYQAALELKPEHEEALYYLGSLRLVLGEYEASEIALERLVRLDPESARAHSQLGVLHACPGEGAPLDLDRAKREFERAWAINREQTGTPLWLGLIALFQDDMRAARARFEDVLGSNPGSVAANYLVGYAFWAEGDRGPAVTSFSAAVRSVPAGGDRELGFGEGDTRDSRPLSAAAASCHWLAERLAAVTAPSLAQGQLDASVVSERYRELDAIMRELRARRF